jgi:hypothetical protein
VSNGDSKDVTAIQDLWLVVFLLQLNLLLELGRTFSNLDTQSDQRRHGIELSISQTVGITGCIELSGLGGFLSGDPGHLESSMFGLFVRIRHQTISLVCGSIGSHRGGSSGPIICDSLVSDPLQGLVSLLVGVVPGENGDTVILYLGRLSNSPSSSRRVQSIFGFGTAMVASGVEVQLRVHVSGIESNLGSSSASWYLLTEAGSSDSRESIVSRKCKGEGMACIGRGSGSVDHLDCGSATARAQRNNDLPSLG